MIYQSLLQLKNSQKTVEVLLDNGYSSFKGKVSAVTIDSVLMSVCCKGDDGLTWYEVVVKMENISSVVYKKELENFSTENKIEDDQEVRT